MFLITDSSSNRVTHNLIEHTFKEIYSRSCNARKKEFSCENDWHDDSNHGSLPDFFFSLLKVYPNTIPKL